MDQKIILKLEQSLSKATQDNDIKKIKHLNKIIPYVKDHYKRSNPIISE